MKKNLLFLRAFLRAVNPSPLFTNHLSFSFNRKNVNLSKFLTLLFFLMFLLGTAQTTQTYSYTGSNQTFTVPSGVTSVSVKVWGAGSGNASQDFYGGSGGSGGFIQGNLTVTPGSTLHIAVGGGGKASPSTGLTGGAGGWPGGGAGGNGAGGGNNVGNGSGGGGYTGIFTSSTYSQANALLIAGGAGGAGGISGGTYYASGGGAGGNGWNQNNLQTTSKGAGQTGSLTVGGTGGIGNNITGGVGSSLTGGNGSSITVNKASAGGGGGGGYFGGGGGGGNNTATITNNSGGGGGGFSYVTNSNFALTTNTLGNSDPNGGLVAPPNTGDIDYQTGIGVGQAATSLTAVDGGNGLIVITYSLPTPVIILSSNTFAAGTITQNTTNNLVYSFAVSTSVSPATLTGLNINTSTSTYLAADITNFKLWYQPSSATFNSASAGLLSTFTTSGAPGAKTFPAFSQATATGTTGYYFITTDVPCATAANTVVVNSITSANTTFASGIPTGTAAAGNNQTIVLSTPLNVTGSAASVANASSSISWTAPAGCYSEIMIVASPAGNTGGAPSGNGSAYTGNLIYGSGTTFGNGFVAYKGIASPQIMSGLTNGIPYFYKIFTRNGTLWSSGVEVSAIPNIVYCSSTGTGATPTVYFTNFTTTSGSTNINNTSTYSANGYGDFTSPQVVTKYQSGTINFTTTIKGIGGGAGVGIYVDWNNNGSFADPGEFVFSTNGYAFGNVSGTFSVPANASLGNKRMRIVVNYNSTNPQACNTGINGETEDYTVNVTAPCTMGIPSSVSGKTYIDGVGSTGTIINAVSSVSGGYTAGGYKDNSSFTIATQIPNGPVNLDLSVVGGSFIYVFVDYNNNGNFNDPGELVYSTTNSTTGSSTATGSTSFGFIVPPGQAPGNYKVRIRTSPFGNLYPGDGIISPCDTGYSSGETEDFNLAIVPDCPSKITGVTNGTNCGPGPVTISATSPGATSFKWYDSKRDGNLLNTTTTGSWPIPSVPATTTYYVTAVNGCESLYRTPVLAVIYPVANIVFSPASPEICGAGSVVALSASGDFSTEDLFVEDFEGGTLGKFKANQLVGSVSSVPFAVQTSSYIPNNTTVFKPAINSGGAGTSGNKFAFTTSDAAQNPTFKASSQALETITGINTNGFTTLTLLFDQYYSEYSTDSVVLEVSLNGAAYTPVITYSADDGTAGNFANKVVDFTPYINIANLKFRLRYAAAWDDGYAVDNFRLYGTKPLTTNFDWGVNDGNMFTDAATMNPYTSHALVPNIYVKPDPTSGTSWTYTANTSLPNGCTVSKTIVVPNNTKFSGSSTTDWLTTNWSPTAAVPDATKCVVIKTPITLGVGATGLAKNISVQTGGNLTISGNMTVTDFVNNDTGLLDKLTLKSDANLIQLNNVTNTGSLTAERSLSAALKNTPAAIDYVYWGSPVLGQQTKGAGGFSPGTANDRFFSYRESNDRFYETADLTFTPGRGYAVEAEAGGDPITTVFKFRGVPNNGNINFGVTKSADNPVGTVHGFNLVGNPYPSNISFDRLLTDNPFLVNTVYFWTNLTYTATQMGSNYPGNNYAVFNGTGGNPSSTSNVIKVGQAFIIQTTASGSLSFKNTQRISNAGIFYQKSSNEKNRFWIDLIAPNSVKNSQLIGYIDGATDGFEDNYDNEAFDDYADLFYSILDGKKLVIQGKANNFVDTDKIPLGANLYEDGSYTIALEKGEGIFANGQTIYLKDNVANTVTNLSENSYTFQATKGLSEGRFEVIYKPQSTLSVGDIGKENILIYRDANQFVVKATQKIKDLNLYDASGRLLLNLKPLSDEAKIEAEQLINGVYVLKVTLENGDVVTRKIRK